MEITIDDIKAHLEDRWWRLNNLYYIKDKQGKKVLFKPNEIQKFLYDNLWFMNIVPKARQLGITTFFSILYFDQVLFSENVTAGIIAHRQEDMKKIFKHKIRFAWDHLHPWLKAKIGEPKTESANELAFGNGSSIFVSMSTRSGTVQFLHISEFAYVCNKFPDKAEEIVTGAINSVEAGQMVSIESTAMGREGYFYNFTMTSHRNFLEQQELTPLDFKFFFFPWYTEPKYVLEGRVVMGKELLEYFEILKFKHGIDLTQEQKNWYAKKYELNRDKMYQEYPSTLDEAFSQSVEGAYYAKDMARVYLDKRITKVPHDPMLKVDTWWDLGMNDENVILFTQQKGNAINFIDMYVNSGMGLQHYVDKLNELRDRNGYRYGTHHMPHDVEVRNLDAEGITRKDTFYKLGLRNIKVGKKLPINDGIDRVRTLFARFYFDETKCQALHEALFNYRRDFDAKMGVWKDKPRHDHASHISDAVRLLGNEWRDIYEMTEEMEELADNQSFFS